MLGYRVAAIEAAPYITTKGRMKPTTKTPGLPEAATGCDGLWAWTAGSLGSAPAAGAYLGGESDPLVDVEDNLLAFHIDVEAVGGLRDLDVLQ
jgi:hypothetical protein